MNHLVFWVMLYFLQGFLHETSPFKSDSGLTMLPWWETPRWTWCTWATDKILKKSHPRWPMSQLSGLRGVGDGKEDQIFFAEKCLMLWLKWWILRKLELFQLVVTLRDGKTWQRFWLRFLPLQVRFSTPEAAQRWSFACEVSSAKSWWIQQKGQQKKICCIPSVHERLNFLRSFTKASR